MAKVERFNVNEKAILKSLVSAKLDVLESKQSDVNSLAKKNAAWVALTDEFNAHEHVCKRSTKQLKKCWENQKVRRKRLLAAETRQRMATGGGPPATETPADPEMDIILPAITHQTENAFDSDTLTLQDAGLVVEVVLQNKEESSAVTEGVLETSTGPPHTSTPRPQRTLAATQVSRSTAVEREMEARLNRVACMRNLEEELHHLKKKELETRETVAKIQLTMIKKEELHQEKKFLREEETYRLEDQRKQEKHQLEMEHLRAEEKKFLREEETYRLEEQRKQEKHRLEMEHLRAAEKRRQEKHDADMEQYKKRC